MAGPLLAAALPRVARIILTGMAAIWVLLELRQSTNRRPEAVKADKGSQYILRLAVVVGAVVAMGAARLAPGAIIRPSTITAWMGLGSFWCGIALRLTSAPSARWNSPLNVTEWPRSNGRLMHLPTKIVDGTLTYVWNG